MLCVMSPTRAPRECDRSARAARLPADSIVTRKQESGRGFNHLAVSFATCPSMSDVRWPLLLGPGTQAATQLRGSWRLVGSRTNLRRVPYLSPASQRRPRGDKTSLRNTDTRKTARAPFLIKNESNMGVAIVIDHAAQLTGRPWPQVVNTSQLARATCTSSV